MGGGHEQLLGCGAVAHTSAHVEGFQTARRLRLLRGLECSRADHDVSLERSCTAT